MVDEPDDPAVPAEDRDDAMRDQEGDQRDRRGSERRVRCGRTTADDCAERDGDREIERAELGKRAPFPKAQADNGYREEQDSLEGHPSQSARATDQFSHPHHPAAHATFSASPLLHPPPWHSSRAPSCSGPTQHSSDRDSAVMGVRMSPPGGGPAGRRAGAGVRAR